MFRKSLIFDFRLGWMFWIRGLLVLGMVGLGGVVVGTLRANELPFADRFAVRGFIEGTSGSGEGNNRLATIEAGEPAHGDRLVDRTLWVSWVAPAHGLLDLRTDGSKFDTVLAVYAEEAALRGLPVTGGGGGNPFATLREVGAQDDVDEPNALFSRVQVPVRAGVRYEIVVAGYAGAGGDVVLAWDFLETPFPLPVLVHRDADRAVVQGSPARFAFEILGGAPATLQWFRNGVAIPGFVGAEWATVAAGPGDAGHYRLLVTVQSPDADDDDEVAYFSRSFELQLGPQDSLDTLARDKVLGWSESGETGTLGLEGFQGGGFGDLRNVLPPAESRRQLQVAGPGVTRGYSGTQVFETALARRDPGEPDHCGNAGSASYWYRYNAPADGTLTLDTVGSSYDTVLAVYTFSPPVRGYADLIEVACNDDAPGASGRSRVSLAVASRRPYLVVVDGKNGARGNAWLNWKLAASGSRVGYVRSERGLVMTVPTVPGVRYQLEVADSPGGGWRPFLSHTGGEIPWTLTNDYRTAPVRFFRVSVP